MFFSKEHAMKNKLLNAFVIALILFQAFAPIGALAYTGTDQSDYQPGAVVYISGDNSDGVGFAAGEIVHVELTGPNAFATSCDATASDSAVWVCQLTLPADAADGSYTYVATGGTSGVSQSGGFTVIAPASPIVELTQVPTVEPTTQPTEPPTVQPTDAATEVPTAEPTQAPTSEPTSQPTVEPTASPTAVIPVLTPFITSDKEDYAPAELVTLTSGNWQPSEWVVVSVNDNVGQSWSITTNKQADANGAFTYQFNLPNWFVAQYHVYTYGTTSGVATADFTDAVNLKILGKDNGSHSKQQNEEDLGSFPQGTSLLLTCPRGTGLTLQATGLGSTQTVNFSLAYIAGYGNNSTLSPLTQLNPGTGTLSNGSGDICEAVTIPTSTLTVGTIYHGQLRLSQTGGVTANPDDYFFKFTVTSGTAATTTSVTSSSNPSTYGSSVTFTATVNSTSTPTGSVSFSIDGGSGVAGTVGATTSTTATWTLTTSTLTVGTHTVQAFYTHAGNFSDSNSNTLNQTVNKANTVTAVTCPAGVTYTGSALTPCSAAVTGPGGLNQSLTVSYSNNTNVGTASASASFAGDGSYNDSSDSKTFTINKAASTTTVTCPSSVPYDSSAQTPCTASATGAGALNQTLTVSYTNNTDAGTATASANFAGDTNHTASSDSKNFTIAKAASTTIVSCPASVAYDGSAQTPCTASVTSVGGLNQTLTVSYTNNTDAGTATASASFASDANHAGSSDSKTFAIEKADSITTITCPASVTYDGSAQTPCTASVNGAGGLNQTISVTYSDNTNAGTATANASFAGDANHNGSSDSKTFAISKASSTTTLTCPLNVTYTGSALTPCSATVIGVGGLNEPVTVTYTDNTNAGTATANATFGGDANHSSSSDSKTLAIDKAATTTTLTCPSNVTYTGSPLEPCTAKATGAGGLDQSLTVDYTDNTTAGTADASASFAGDGNHTGSNKSTTFSIDKAASVVSIVCPSNVTYDGSAQTPCTATATGAGGLNQPLTVSYSDNTNAGTASASASYAGDANHASNSSTKNFTVDKAASVTKVSCPASVIYNGAAQTPCTAAVTGAGGLSQSLTVAYADNTDAGAASAIASYAGDTNHTGSSDSKNFTVEKAASVTTVSCLSHVTYDGAAQEPCSASINGAGGLSGSLTVSYSNNVNAGTATASASYAGDANHTASDDTQHFTIDKADAVITVTPYHVTYDGNAHTATGSAQGVEASPVDLTSLLHLGGTTHTNAGDYTADSWAFDGNSNYNATSGTVHDQVDKANAHITVTPYLVTYDGNAHTAIGSASGVESIPADLTSLMNLDGTTHTKAGDYTADGWTFAGNGNYNPASGTVHDEIDKAASTTTLACPPHVTYTGSALEPCSAMATGAGGLNEDVNVVYGNNTNAGTATASATYAGDDNHAGSSDNSTFTIDKAASVTTVTCPASVTYDGSAQTPCAAKATGAGGLDQSLSVTYANNVDAGTATASASYVGDDNHNPSSNTKDFTINRASSTTVVTVSNATYDGDSHGGSANVTGAGGLSASVTVSYSGRNGTTYGPSATAPTDAGDYVASATYEGDGNHFGSTDSTNFTIFKAASTTTVTCPANVTYTGSQLTPCSATVTGAGGLSQSLAVIYTNNTDAGTASATAIYAGDDNHTGSSDSKNFTIDKADSATVVSCPASVTYNGSAQTLCTASVTGAGGLSQTLTVSYSNNTNAGTASASASYAGDANHKSSSDSKNFTIDKAPSTTAVTCTASVTYDGTAQTPCTAKVTGVGGLNQSLTVGYTNNTNAGTASASASYAGDANHTDSSNSQTFTIAKATSTTTVTCPASVTYTGSPVTPCTAAVTGAGGLNQVLTVTYTNNTAVGVNTATASATYAGDANHESSFATQKFSILYSTGMCLGSAGHTILQPINGDGTSVFKQGSTVPAKFRVCDANGNSIGTAGVVASFRLVQSKNGTIVSTIDEAVDSTTPDSTFRWSASDQQWIFNMNTKSLKANTTYYYDITLNDGSHILFQFGLK
jgi:hypothetical protein